MCSRIVSIALLCLFIQTSSGDESSNANEELLKKLYGAFYDVFKNISDKMEACKKETNISQDIFNKVEQHEKVDDQVAKEYMLCYLQKLELMNANGEMVETKVREILRGGRALSNEEKKCLEQKGTKLETAFNFYNCMP